MRAGEILHAGISFRERARTFGEPFPTRNDLDENGWPRTIKDFLEAWIILFVDVVYSLYLKISSVYGFLVERWQQKRLNHELENLKFESSAVRDARIDNDGGHVKPNGTFFTHLPPEIHRRVLIEAFGYQTIHMDLTLRHPYAPVPDVNKWLSATAGTPIHANIHGDEPDDGPVYDTSRRKKWRWFSCVCHRYEPEGRYLLLGRRCNFPSGPMHEPDRDRCLTGHGYCTRWPGQWPGKCFIGITGWLLSCKQAYWDGMQILYGTNTIHVASNQLIRSMPDILSSNILSMMTSLEIVWDAKQVLLTEGFVRRSNTHLMRQGGDDQSLELGSKGPIFPALLFLRISMKPLGPIQVPEDTSPTQISEFKENPELSRKIHLITLCLLDQIVDRMVPARTDVTFSCANWGWYQEIDLKLIEEQGFEETRPQRADIEGLKCWRKTPPKLSNEEICVGINHHQEDTALSESRREGYWVHIPYSHVRLHYPDEDREYDWHRQELYGLGTEPYGYPNCGPPLDTS